MSSLYRPHFGAPTATSPRVLCLPSGQKALWADGTVKPTDGTAGYEHGCFFQETDGTTGADALYVNIGSITSCNFDLVQTTSDAVALAATAAEINRAADVSTRLVTLAGSTSITEALHEGKTCLMTGTGAAFTQTLPAATGSGGRYRFVVGAVNTSNHVIYTGNASIAYVGNIISNATGDAPDLTSIWPSTSAATITLNGTTTGGVQVGDYIEVQDIAVDAWAVRGVTTSSGAEATPFS